MVKYIGNTTGNEWQAFACGVIVAIIVLFGSIIILT